MNVHSIFVFTHDGLAVGEDGPTHQPVEHLAALRAVPNLTVLRPADANETAHAWRIAVERKKPVCLILTRQKLPIIDSGISYFDGPAKGAYVISDCKGTPEVIIIATGSEVSLSITTSKELSTMGIKARVVSMLSREIFLEQPDDYRQKIILPTVKARVAVEAGSSMGWHRFVGDIGDVVSVDRFGASAPGSLVMDRYGFNTANIIERVLAVIEHSKKALLG